MTLSILFSTLLGIAAGYPLMKLDLKSAHNEKVQNILGWLSHGLAVAVCVLPFFLLKFPASIIIVSLMTIASLRKTLAVSIFFCLMGFLIDGEEGLILSIVCPSFILVPGVILFSIFRHRSKSKPNSVLKLAEDQKTPQESELKTKPELHFSLRTTAIYCALALLSIELTPLNVGAIQSLFWIDKALPRIVASTKDNIGDVTQALKSYGKVGVPSEIEVIRQIFQEGWNDRVEFYFGHNDAVAELTVTILEIGEGSSLSQLGEDQKKALKIAAISSRSPRDKLAIDELVKLKALPELVDLLGLNGMHEYSTQALLQFLPNETIPLIMKWQVNHDEICEESATTFDSGGKFNFCAEFAKYGVRVIPELIPYLGDENKKVRLLATHIFRKIGPRAIPVLESLLDSNNFLIVNQAAYILGMSGEKSAVPILIKKIKQQEDDDGTLAEALSYISDERATQFFISDYQVWKNSFEQGKNLEEQNVINIYDESIARTKTQLAKSFLERAATQSKSLTNRKHLIQLLGIYFWKGKSKEKMGGWIEALESSSADQSRLAVSELRAMGDPVVLPFLVAADERAHKTGTSVKNCEIHAAIAAFSK